MFDIGLIRAYKGEHESCKGAVFLTTGRTKTMIRYEVRTEHKCFVGYEDTMQEAKKYIKGLKDNGVKILSVYYFDKDARERDIREGKV